ncbi:MAG TPA: NapC/NirT family cytochrome c [candidate division Zixibacteria bacterium]|nr:NapC/NirT family cytochrome c [candidate division Zixibacteria bacterium]
MRTFFSKISRNLVSFTGLLAVFVSAALIITILAIDILGFHINPYIGILVYLILPAILIFGVVLIPVGLALERRRQHLQKGLPRELALPRIELDLNRPDLRRRISWFVAVLAIFLSILSTSAYKAVEFMDSVTFCGKVCHEVMEPELVSYSQSPHSRVACVSCHIGPGAPWFVKSKISGVRQVFAVTLNTYSKPIPVPVKDLRPARETCEQCHWPQKFHGEQLKVITHFSEDEKNTPLKTVLLLRTGGGDKKTGIAEGIHWHMNIANEISYIATDEERQVIPWVRLKDLWGNVREYATPDFNVPPESLAKLPVRTMDCVDCHNRPTHIYKLPEEAVDEAMQARQVNPNLPFLKKVSVELLRREYPDKPQALRQIKGGLMDYYKQNHPALAAAWEEDILKAAEKLAEIYATNVFPSMKISWGTYKNNIGHMNFPGCFRCHDDNHASKDGKTIRQDCDQCHSLLAVDEENPKPVIETLPLR